MISNAVAEELARQIPALTVGTNLFAESGQGTQYVVVKTTNVVNTAEPIDDFRQSTLQILINGYSANAGAILASQIVNVLQHMRGNYAFTYNDGTTTLQETYNIQEHRFVNFPVPIKTPEGRISYSINIVFFYFITVN